MASTDFTKVPNYFFDHMADMDKCELSVVLLVIRKTVGYQKEWDRISFSQFISEAGLERASVDKGIKAALDRGIIERRETKNSFEYRLREPEIGSKNEPFLINEDSENSSKNEPKTSSENEPKSETSSENEPKSVQKLNTQKKRKKKNNNPPDETKNKKDEPEENDKDPERDEWFNVICWLVFSHQDRKLLNKEDFININNTINTIRNSKEQYTLDELKRWYKEIWSTEWPGKQKNTTKIQHPSYKDIKTGIGRIRPTVSPVGLVSSLNGSADSPRKRMKEL